MSITSWLETKAPFSSLQEELAEKKRILLLGMAPSLEGWHLFSLAKKERRMIIIVPQEERVYQLKNELENWGLESIYTFTANDSYLINLNLSDLEKTRSNIEALNALAEDKEGIFLINSTALTQYVMPKNEWQEQQLHLEVGKEYAFSELLEQLVRLQYKRVDEVTDVGEFSLRGGILDIYPVNQEEAVRIDFFAEEIDSIRSFSVETQRSLEEKEYVQISPLQLLWMTKEDREHAKAQLQALHLPKEELLEKEVFSFWAEGEDTPYDRHYLPFYRSWGKVTDYFSTEDILVWEDLSQSFSLEKNNEKEWEQWQQEQYHMGYLPYEVPKPYSLRALRKACPHQGIYYSFLQKGLGNLSFDATYPFHCQHLQRWFGQLDQLKKELQMYQTQQWTILFTAKTKEGTQKIAQVLSDIDEEAIFVDDEIYEGKMQIALAPFEHGFSWEEGKVLIITERELFASVKQRVVRSHKENNVERLKQYTDLKVGDYVVHINHGIGQYLGLETIERDGIHQDYLKIQYQNEDQLFIPVDQLNCIQKYVSLENKTPKLNRLDNKTWHKTKHKVERQVEDMADELIELYAQRQLEKGFAFSKDDEVQRKFEDQFPYAETEDQLRSTREIKADMEKEQPMDRLLVGDVGYGKTEVALRAAFKAIRDHKQVAFLVPTTILAEQHYTTIMKRLRDFPYKVGILNRFKSKKEQKEILNELAEGTIDIIVGTHRLLSKDVIFHDLGLIIIDEEQRFGVRHKERLKQLKTKVDVLTLTATPIPRTLHMSMMGVRDLSVLETPPMNRYPVQTYVLEYNLEVVRDAIEREVARGGQVFYLFNQVETMPEKLQELQQWMPNLRFLCAHGQMQEHELENVLFEFLSGNADVLITTTIIETGVDMPNVNTIIVDGAEKMGLSQLYQLKGRVGRSSRLAHAYFMYPPFKLLSGESEERLSALREFTQLGAGFKIAMRDLSIRGAGDILGSKQHGFINEVGFDLYNELLQQAVARKQGKVEVQYPDTKIHCVCDAYIPNDYIQSPALKVEMYRRLRCLSSKEELAEITMDFIDRFGEYPKAVQNLLDMVALKWEASHAYVEKIEEQKDQWVIFMNEKAPFTPPQYMQAIPSKNWQMKKQGTQLFFVYKEKQGTWQEHWQCVAQFCQNLREMEEKHVAAKDH